VPVVEPRELAVELALNRRKAAVVAPEAQVAAKGILLGQTSTCPLRRHNRPKHLPAPAAFVQALIETAKVGLIDGHN
jgi:hypothetical protein